MTPSQIGMVRTLLVKAGVMDYKADLALSYSNGRTESLKAMTHDETVELVKYLNDMLGLTENPAARMRRKILSIAHELHWELPGTNRIDMERVDKWCIAHTGAKKPLDGLSISELNKAVTGITIYYRQFLKGI